jgi:hypothetical protein
MFTPAIVARAKAPARPGLRLRLRRGARRVRYLTTVFVLVRVRGAALRFLRFLFGIVLTLLFVVLGFVRALERRFFAALRLLVGAARRLRRRGLIATISIGFLLLLPFFWGTPITALIPVRPRGIVLNVVLSKAPGGFWRYRR